MTKKGHAELAQYIQDHGVKHWDLNVEVKMPGEDGELLFKDHKLPGQSAAARAYGKEGGRACKGAPKTGSGAKGVNRETWSYSAVALANKKRVGVLTSPQDFHLAFASDLAEGAALS
jgi:hypothetical protein